MPAYVKEPLFQSYGAFEEKRPVLVDCSLGINPLEDLYAQKTLNIQISRYACYPQGGAHGNESLASFIRSRWPSVSSDEICFGAGSQGTISSLGRILGGVGVLLRGFLPQFIPALLEFSGTGARVELTRLQAPDYTLIPGELCASLTSDTTALYVDNPNNPTGRALPLEQISFLARACEERGALLIVDEAYADFIDDANSALNLPGRNIICMRSFSKGCGLAGLRVGYIVIRDPKLRSYYRESGLHFSASALAADVAANLAPELDLASMRARVSKLKSKTMRFIDSYADFSIAPTSETTPILLLNWKTGKDLYDTLMDVGIQAEPGKFFELPESCVRLRIPGTSQFELFCAQWRKAFGQA